MDPLRSVSAISLFTPDLAASKKFYTTVFGATVAFEDAESCAVSFNNLVINNLDIKFAPDLVKPRSVAAQSPDIGKAFQLSIWVQDLDAAVDRLKACGVQFLNGPELKPWGMKVVTFEDPGGHVWEVGQQMKHC